jgi:SEC-C motif domain protein
MTARGRIPAVPVVDVPLRECSHGRTRVSLRPGRGLSVVLRAAPRRRTGADRRVADALPLQRIRRGDVGYLLRTWHPSGRPRTLSLDPALRWTRLAVLETRDGGLFDATGTVQFRAMYVQQGRRGVLAETSRFVRQDGHWTYLGAID